MPTHTPGPWTVGTGCQTILATNAQGLTSLVAKVALKDTEVGEPRANARLIAAAPEMLALLMAHLDCELEGTCSWQDDARDILARIEGRP